VTYQTEDWGTGLEKWPEPHSITFASPEDAKEMEKVLNDIYEELRKLHGELEGQWIHIRNLEDRLLAKGEYPGEWKLDI
jgi:hypothetical protein